MSDLGAAAAALGIPEALVKRSAEARAKEAGVSVEEILAAWAGGAAPHTAPQPDASLQSPDASQDEATPAPEPLDEPSPPQQPAAITTTHDSLPRPPRLAPRVSDAPPVLVGRVERTGGLVAGVLGILILSLLLAVVAPAIPMEGDGVRSSRLPFTAAALDGRDIYLQQGCGSCHTQLVRNVVSDVGLGPVTLSDTNQIVGYRRYGPDLASVGSRITDVSGLESILRGGSQHPAITAISNEELSNLIAYLMESR
ncbi:MAG TPA: cbb3-type cytochrome c oxidase subunit II [Acidimicrobiia bacterium]|nr:cbb3-type cytochrome c oxidase subunit II [Acidimicrobiia bacterium]